jgi:hypothetical protein
MVSVRTSKMKTTAARVKWIAEIPQWLSCTPLKCGWMERQLHPIKLSTSWRLAVATSCKQPLVVTETKVDWAPHPVWTLWRTNCMPSWNWSLDCIFVTIPIELLWLNMRDHRSADVASRTENSFPFMGRELGAILWVEYYHRDGNTAVLQYRRFNHIKTSALWTYWLNNAHTH